MLLVVFMYWFWLMMGERDGNDSICWNDYERFITTGKLLEDTCLLRVGVSTLGLDLNTMFFLEELSLDILLLLKLVFLSFLRVFWLPYVIHFLFSPLGCWVLDFWLSLTFGWFFISNSSIYIHLFAGFLLTGIGTGLYLTLTQS